MAQRCTLGKMMHFNVRFSWFCILLALCLVMPLFPLTDNWAELMEVNHDDKVVTTEHFDLPQEMERLTLDLMKPTGREVERRLTSPVINTSLDTKNIAFERYELRLCILISHPFTAIFSGMYVLVGNYGWIGIFFYYGSLSTSILKLISALTKCKPLLTSFIIHHFYSTLVKSWINVFIFFHGPFLMDFT